MKIKRYEVLSKIENDISLLSNYTQFLSYIERVVKFTLTENCGEVVKKFSYALQKNAHKFQSEYNSIMKNMAIKQTPEYKLFLDEFIPLSKEKFQDEKGNVKDQVANEALFNEIMLKYPKALAQYNEHKEWYSKYIQEEIDIAIHSVSNDFVPPMGTAERAACDFMVGKEFTPAEEEVIEVVVEEVSDSALKNNVKLD